MAHKTNFKSRRGNTETNRAKASADPRSAGRDASDSDALTPAGNLRTAERLIPWVVGVIALLVYMSTMTPGMQMGDGTELATAASVLGVPHPTGYPLYMLLCKLWLVITFGGEVIARTTLLNCIIMAAAAGLTSVIVKDLLRVIWRVPVSKPVLAISALTGLLTAFLRFHWENAIVTEVYALQFLLMLIFVRLIQKMDLIGGPTRRGLIALTVVFALAMAHHRLSVTLILPYIGTWIWAWRKGLTQGGIRPKTIVSALFILLGGAALYLYIPLRAAAHPPVNWGNAATWSAFYNHVRGTEYLDRGLLKPGLGQEFSGSSARQYIWLQTKQVLGDMAGQIVGADETLFPGPPGSQKVFILRSYIVIIYGLVFLAAATWGFICAWKVGARATTLAIASIAALNMAILYVYNIADIRDYYLFPFWAAIIGILMMNPTGRSYDFAQTKARIGLYCIGGLVLVIAALNYPRCNRATDISAELLSATILPESTDVMPAGSILITDDDAETFTTWYRQIVRGDRPDVLNFAGNFVYMPWYSAFFTPEQLRDYQITLAPHVARSADEYARQLRTAIIDKNASAHPIFTSINDPAVLRVLAADYAISPVDAVAVTNPLYDESTTHVLYKIALKK